MIGLGVLASALSFTLAEAQYGSPSLSVSGSSGTAVDVGSLYFFAVSAQGISDPQYVVTDQNPASGGTVGTIDKAGSFMWKPTIYDAGWHTLVVSATDILGHAASTTISVLVRNNDLLLTSLTPGTTVTVGATTSATVTAPGFVSPSYTVYDGMLHTSIDPTKMSSAGVFTWVPKTDDIGVHTVTFAASDTNGHNGRLTKTITVVPVAAPTSAPVAATTSAATGAAGSPAATAPTSSASGAPAFAFTANLASGSRGRSVTELQKKLSSLGFLSAAPTGYYGPATIAAVKKYQKTHGISQTGTVGPATRKALNAN